MLQTTLRALVLGSLLAGPALAQTGPPLVLPESKSPAPADSARSGPRPAMPEPLYLFNARIIGSPNEVSPQDLASITVWNAGQVPPGWSAAATMNVLAIELKPGVRLPSRPLSRLKRQLHVGGPVRYLFDGWPLPDDSFRLAVGSLERAEVLPPAAGEAATTIILHLKPYQQPPRSYPPGTILIRGVAGR